MPTMMQLVEYHLEEIVLKGAWAGPAALCLTLTLWLPSPNCRFLRSCLRSTSAPTLPSALAKSCTTICGNQPENRCACEKKFLPFERSFQSFVSTRPDAKMS